MYSFIHFYLKLDIKLYGIRSLVDTEAVIFSHLKGASMDLILPLLKILVFKHESTFDYLLNESESN